MGRRLFGEKPSRAIITHDLAHSIAATLKPTPRRCYAPLLEDDFSAGDRALHRLVVSLPATSSIATAISSTRCSRVKLAYATPSTTPCFFKRWIAAERFAFSSSRFS